MITEEELKTMLLESGFVSVEKIKIDSSDVADSFLVRK